MQNSGRTKFKRTSIDRLMNTLVLWVSFPEVLPQPLLPPWFFLGSSQAWLLRGGVCFRRLSDLEDVVLKALGTLKES